MTAFALRDITRHLDKQLAEGVGDEWLLQLQRRALDEFKAQGLPTAKTEDWKYTSLRKLANESFGEPITESQVAVPSCDARFLLVVINGRLKPDLSRLGDLPYGVKVSGIDSVQGGPVISPDPQLGSIVDLAQHPFAAINCAGLSDALLIDVAAGVEVKEPLVIMWLTAGGEQIIVHPRLFVRMGEGSRFTLMEQHLGEQTGHLVNKLGEFNLADGAQFAHVQLQSTAAEHLINGCHVRCHHDSVYRAQNYDLGGNFIRNDLVVSLTAPGSEAELDGLFVTADDSHVDNHVRIDHHSPHCRSNVLYKGLLGERGHGVFNGKLVVHPQALKTDARQVNHNLLISPNVEINTKPELEIYADDVKCSHGCTTGALEPGQLFYLKSRGIGRRAAESLLVEAFGREIIEHLPSAELIPLITGEVGKAITRLLDTEGQRRDA